jgi:hypothetical protein
MNQDTAHKLKRKAGKQAMRQGYTDSRLNWGQGFYSWSCLPNFFWKCLDSNGLGS